MKRIASVFLATAMILTAVTGCGTKPAEPQVASGGASPATSSAPAESPKELKGTLVMMTNASENVFDATKTVVDNFMKEHPGVTVEFSTQTKDYESLMKAKMSANDLPDVFATHGWSVNRYSEYLMPLNDQPFSSEILDTLNPIISNEKGEIFVLPINLDQGGMIYNKDILKAIGKEIPKTLEEFMAVCEAAKQAGYIPVYMAGKDDRQPANMLDITAVSWLISNEKSNFAKELQDGSFEWSNWDQVAQYLLDMRSKGYLNIDAVTADPVTVVDKLAEGKILFMFANNSNISNVYKVDPSVNLGMMPVPTVSAEDEPFLIGGEREAYGVWKDSPNKELALELLNFMSKPENIQIICNSTATPSALKNIEVDLGTVAGDYAAYQNLRTFPYFDRVYLPSGMWAVLRTTGGALLAGEATAQDASAIMKENYNKLRSQTAN